MGNSGKKTNAEATARKKQLADRFFKKGLIIAISSGMIYGFYTAFITLAMGTGVWAKWYDPAQTLLSAFTVAFVVAVLGNGLNDFISGIWAIIKLISTGKVGDFILTLKSKPGRIMILAALVGGPIAGSAYVVALQMGGTLIVPIAALNCAVGAILGRIFFKQELNLRMIIGILICLAASTMVGFSAGLGETGDANKIIIGLLIAFVAAVGWGFEGVVAGFGTAMIDTDIGIAIRQTTSGIANLFIVFPILAAYAGGGELIGTLFKGAFTDGSSLIIFALSGLASVFTFSLWYKGNSMCGAALGMACNGAYAFWGPFVSWIILGLIYKWDAFLSLPILAWAGAVVMAFGIFVIAVDPREYFRKKD